MKNLFLICVCTLMVFQSCKKDDDNYSGAVSNKITPASPPSGFSFPRTYKLTGTKNDFHVWIKDVDRTPFYETSYFFGTEQDPFVSFNFKLVDRTKIQAIDLTGQKSPEEANYYFYQDTLYVVDNNDTFSFAKGNYYGFSIALSSYKITGQDNNGFNTVRTISGNQGNITKAFLENKFADWRIIDTLVIYNRLVQYN
jgi:hypothetical protein